MSYLANFITGTLVNYYVTCKREAWLYSRKISVNQDDENILIGRVLSQIEEDKLHDFPFSNLKFDKIDRRGGHYIVTEYKKSLSNPEGAKMQLLFYMWQLKTNLKLKEIKGVVVSGRTKIAVSGDKNSMKFMENLVREIEDFISTPTPPQFKKIKYCSGCAYRDYCL